MSGRITEHLRSNVVGYVAIFLFAIGGTAYATHPGGANTISTGDIINGEVKTADVGTGEVGSADIANDGVTTIDILDDSITQNKILAGAVRTSEIANNNVQSVDVLDETLTALDLATESVGSNEIINDTVTGGDLAGSGFGDDGFAGDEEIIDGTVTGFDLAQGTVGSFHVGDDSLDGQDISDSFLSAGYGSDSVCNDDDQNGEQCAATTFSLGEAGRVLLNWTAEWRTISPAPYAMSCQLRVDGTAVGIPQSFGEAGNNHPIGNEGTAALTALTDALAAGSHTFDAFCTETDGDIDVRDNQITAARVDE